MEPGVLLLLLGLLAPLAPRGECQPPAALSLAGKLGECPPPARIGAGPCAAYCSSDGDCPGSARCCSDGCGRQCLLPPGEKPGFCPQLPPGVMTICLVRCGSDSDCSGNAKCCSMGCHVHCVQPVKARPGVCPKRKVLHTFAPCTNACTDDTQCPPGKKCCFTGCGLGCLTPVWGLRAGGERATPSRSPRLPPAPSSSSSSSSDGVCSLRPVRGPCRGHLRRYFYNPLAKACQAFIYSGCGGNRNNFPSRRECQQACRKSAAQVCRLPKVPGTCLAHIPSYFYNAATRRCERFIYKGCTGNENRFASEQECRRTCGRPARAKE